MRHSEEAYDTPPPPESGPGGGSGCNPHPVNGLGAGVEAGMGVGFKPPTGCVPFHFGFLRLRLGATAFVLHDGHLLEVCFSEWVVFYYRYY